MDIGFSQYNFKKQNNKSCFVLILILMDIGFSPYNFSVLVNGAPVLILILMDIGFSHSVATTIVVPESGVLILILMDIGFSRKQDSYYCCST